MAAIPSIPEYYAGKSVFITGGTGFLGKCLLEKLLRGCPDIKRVYLLIRPKKGKDVQERLDELFESKVNIQCTISLSNSFVWVSPSISDAVMKIQVPII